MFQWVITSILKVDSTFPTFSDVILRDHSQNIISYTKMHLFEVSWQKRNVISRCVLTHRYSDTDG